MKENQKSKTNSLSFFQFFPSFPSLLSRMTLVGVKTTEEMEPVLQPRNVMTKEGKRAETALLGESHFCKRHLTSLNNVVWQFEFQSGTKLKISEMAKS